jgi:hypothetical protein
MKRYTSKCDRCTNTDLEYFSDPKSVRLQRRLQQVNGSKPGHSSPGFSGMLVLTVAIAISALVYFVSHGSLSNGLKKVTTAAAPSAVSH